VAAPGRARCELASHFPSQSIAKATKVNDPKLDDDERGKWDWAAVQQMPAPQMPTSAMLKAVGEGKLEFAAEAQANGRELRLPMAWQTSL